MYKMGYPKKLVGYRGLGRVEVVGVVVCAVEGLVRNSTCLVLSCHVMKICTVIETQNPKPENDYAHILAELKTGRTSGDLRF